MRHYRLKCVLLFLATSLLGASAASGETSAERMLIEDLASLEKSLMPATNGVAYDLSQEHRRLAVADLQMVDGRPVLRRIVPDPSPDVQRADYSVVLTNDGMLIRRTDAATETVGWQVTDQHLRRLNAQGEFLEQLPRTLSNEEDLLPTTLFSPRLLREQWLDYPWMKRYAPPAGRGSFITQLLESTPEKRVYEVEMRVAASSSPPRSQFRRIAWERAVAGEAWLPTLVELMNEKRQVYRSLAVQWNWLDAPNGRLPLPTSMVRSEFTPDPESGGLVPTAQTLAQISSASVRFRTASSDLPIWAEVARTPAPAVMSGPEPELPVSSHRTYLAAFFICVVAVAVLLAFRRLRSAQ